MVISRIFVSLVLIFICNAETIYRKQLAGPPSEFILHSTLPEPADAAITSSTSMIFVNMEQHANVADGFFWKGEILADSTSTFAFSLYVPFLVQLTVTDPTGNSINLVDFETKDNLEVLGTTVPVSTYLIRNALIGAWHVQIQASSDSIELLRSSRIAMVGTADAVIFVFNESPTRLISNLNTFKLVPGSSVGLEVRIEDSSSLDDRKRVLKDVIFEAVLEVTFPNGKTAVVDMMDDGLLHDKEANDGEFVAVVTSSDSGNYLAQAIISGIDMKGIKFMRTSQHFFAIAADSVSLTGIASATTVVSSRIIVSIGVDHDVTANLRAYAEVWGKGSSDIVPICWVGGLVNTHVINGKPFVDLEIDVDWISLAGASGPFSLRNVVLQFVDTWAIASTFDEIPVKILENVQQYLGTHLVHSNQIQITERMLEGIRPAVFMNASESLAGSLVLLHGYCSDTNPWPSTDFTNGNYFLNKKASISHDEFARKLISWSNNLGSFSALGHSQGGPVLAHTKNYYWSGLDLLKGTGRIIQSVGSPYLGCSAAGSLANIGKIFGVGCGMNVDLTVDGSARWILGITTATRSKMFYYTSTYKLGTTFGDYCSLPMNIILEWPNDGTSELDYTKFSNANNMGNKQEWCHIEGFKYPAQTLDLQQNKIINAAAARS